MFKLVVLLLSSFASIDSENISQECNSLFEANDPNGCWTAPQFDYRASGECEPDCQTGECCLAECLTRAGYIGEKPEKEKFLKIYEDYNYNGCPNFLKELWMPVISESFDFCERLVDKMNGTGWCDIPIYFIPMLYCIKQQNLINCPKELFQSNERCDAVRKFVTSQDTCGDKYGDIFLINRKFFDLSDEKIWKCYTLFQQHKPSNCSQIPYSAVTQKAEDDCKEKCKDNLDKCCMLKCHHDTSGNMIGDEIQKDKMIESFKNSFILEDEKAFETWLPVIEKAFDVCNSLVSEVKTKSWCNLPAKDHEAASCMQQEMLLNVPATLMLDAAACENVQNFVKSQTTCGKKYGEVFVIDRQFWAN